MIALPVFLWRLQHREYFPYQHSTIAMETVGLLVVLGSAGDL